MKRYFGLIATIAVVLAVLIGLNAAGTITLDRPSETELLPLRSTYNPGPTGTRAFYQLLEESGYQIARWRESYQNLNLAGSNAKGASLIVVGPFLGDERLAEEETEELQKWVAKGGKLLIVSRNPRAQFADEYLHAEVPPPLANKSASKSNNREPATPVEEKSDLLISQPTALTRDIRGFVISQYAARLSFHPLTKEAAQTKVEADEPEEDTTPPPTKSAPSPTATPATEKSPPPRMPDSMPGGVAFEPQGDLAAPVVHLGDNKGAVLADFEYGKGRIIFLSDPFILANNGVARGANLQLALNLVQALGGEKQKIFFDEYHHGYHSQGNALMNYFRGTPVPWLFAQLLLVAAFIAYSYGRRFARALPMPAPDRHSPLEFVGSMASLQQAAQARDLALENIYPRWRNRLCRTLGLPPSAPPQSIIARLQRRLPTKEAEVELLKLFSDSERALKGGKLDDQRLIELVAAMRRIAAQLKLA